MKYHYDGFDTVASQPVSGDIDAASEREAVRLLQSRNIEAFKVAPYQDRSVKNKKVKSTDLVLPLQELATLTESGVTLVEAVNALAKNKNHPGLARGFKKIASTIESGESFSSAIAQSTLPFPDYVTHLVSAGESSGQLALSLRNASNQMNYDNALKNDLRSALTYPLVLIGSGVAAMLIIFFAVVPKFTHLLGGDKELPALAWAVLSAGKMANDSPILVLGSVAATILAIIMLVLNPAIRRNVMNALLNVPVIGPWLIEQDAARWSSLCGAMLSARVGLVQSLKLAAESIMYKKRRERARKMINEIQSGLSFSEAISRASLLPDTSLNLVAVGDKTGQLAEMMQAIARLHDEACKRRMKQVLTLIEPIAILVVGVLIGIMILGVVLAITASTDIAI